MRIRSEITRMVADLSEDNGNSCFLFFKKQMKGWIINDKQQFFEIRGN